MRQRNGLGVDGEALVQIDRMAHVQTVEKNIYPQTVWVEEDQSFMSMQHGTALIERIPKTCDYLNHFIPLLRQAQVVQVRERPPHGGAQVGIFPATQLKGQRA